MPLANASTEVPTRKTISEVVSMLVEYGAAAVTVQRDAQNLPSGIGFVLPTAAGAREFVLPARAEAVRKTLIRQGVRIGLTSLEHSQAVAWRIVKDWLRAQLALVESGQVEFAEVMLPFLILETHGQRQTLYQAFTTGRALPGATAS